MTLPPATDEPTALATPPPRASRLSRWWFRLGIWWEKKVYGDLYPWTDFRD
ncbi:MAG: hypothetical protein KIS66_02690 [Fimbriimonadaceae bacterium]|nr:hypothetical protein [Fimbriimonadaceae bacterium]